MVSFFINMARPERFELPTNWFEANYSIQLSYGRIADTNLTKFALYNKQNLTFLANKCFIERFLTHKMKIE